jgi:putative thioredoxin
MIDKLIESAPGNEVPKLLKEADQLFKDQKFGEAKKIYESLIGIDPGNPKIISGLLRCLVQLKKYDDANEIIESLDEETIKAEEIIKIKKLIDNIGNESFENFDDLKLKLNGDPENKEIRFNLANSYLAANETKLGFDELLFLFDEDPKWNDEAAKKKILEYFDILGLNDPNVIDARKKLSSMMFK